MTFVQRFGSSLNLNVHFHVVFLDGVYTRIATGAAVFHDAPAPTRAELESIVEAVHRRAIKWLRRHGHLELTPLEDRSNERALSSPLEACASIAMQRGTMRPLAPDAGRADARESAAVGAEAEIEPPARGRGAVDASRIASRSSAAPRRGGRRVTERCQTTRRNPASTSTSTELRQRERAFGPLGPRCPAVPKGPSVNSSRTFEHRARPWLPASGPPTSHVSPPTSSASSTGLVCSAGFCMPRRHVCDGRSSCGGRSTWTSWSARSAEAGSASSKPSWRRRAREILERLGMPTGSPDTAHARDPTSLDGDEPDEPDAT
ncbi:transposase [Labilithrix luteola]|uniref:transposase n=1 Tax=Labilithrix luteola TaxID=1391654 RepID=UPI0011BAA9D8